MPRISYRLFQVLPIAVVIVIPGLLAQFDPFGRLEIGIWRWLGIPVFIFGAILFVASHRLIYNPSQWTTQSTPFNEPNQLMWRGPYRIVRNPMMDGLYLMLLGEGVVLESTPVLLWFVSVAATTSLIIIFVEEKRLEKKFGDSYRRYKASTPRFIPRVFGS